MNNKNEIIKKSKDIKLITSDVDGVLTDGGMYYNESGEVMKKFNTKDGMGVELCRGKIKVVLITKEKSKIVLKRAKKMKVDKSYIGIEKKENLLPEICKNFVTYFNPYNINELSVKMLKILKNKKQIYDSNSIDLTSMYNLDEMRKKTKHVIENLLK